MGEVSRCVGRKFIAFTIYGLHYYTVHGPSHHYIYGLSPSPCMDPHYHMWATALYIDMSVLTGAGESGKSTIVKQMKILHKDGYSDQ